MQQEPIINHGNFIDTYNYGAMIRSQANSKGCSVIGSRPSKKFRPKVTKKCSKAKTRSLRKNNM